MFIWLIDWFYRLGCASISMAEQRLLLALSHIAAEGRQKETPSIQKMFSPSVHPLVHSLPLILLGVPGGAGAYLSITQFRGTSWTGRHLITVLTYTKKQTLFHLLIMIRNIFPLCGNCRNPFTMAYLIHFHMQWIRYGHDKACLFFVEIVFKLFFWSPGLSPVCFQ